MFAVWEFRPDRGRCKSDQEARWNLDCEVYGHVKFVGTVSDLEMPMPQW